MGLWQKNDQNQGNHRESSLLPKKKKGFTAPFRSTTPDGGKGSFCLSESSNVKTGTFFLQEDMAFQNSQSQTGTKASSQLWGTYTSQSRGTSVYLHSLLDPEHLKCLGSECCFQELKTIVVSYSTSSQLLFFSICHLPCYSGRITSAFEPRGHYFYANRRTLLRFLFEPLYSSKMNGGVPTGTEVLQGKCQVGQCFPSTEGFFGLSRHPGCLFANFHFSTSSMLPAFCLLQWMINQH